jgi:DNA primase
MLQLHVAVFAGPDDSPHTDRCRQLAGIAFTLKRQLVAYAGRSIQGDEPKYRLPPGFHKSQELFLFDRARHSGSDSVIIVEGFFDAAKVWQVGYRNVVALMGSSLSDVQAGLLPQHFRSGLLLLDGDSAGMDVQVIHLKPGVQPHQLEPREINDLPAGHLRPAKGRER